MLKNKMKKIIVFVLTFGIAAGSFACPVVNLNVQAKEERFVDPAGVTAGDYDYVVLPDGTAEITAYHGDGGDVVIPAELGGRKVTGIYGTWIQDIFCGAFQNCSDVDNVTISEGITYIGSEAFWGCGLSGVRIPGSVKSIGLRAFSECYSLTSAIIAEGLTCIEAEAFADSENLSMLSIPGSVTEIESNAFRGTAWLENQKNDNSLVIVNGILIDGTTAFGRVNVPVGVKRIGAGAFENCDDLTEIFLPESVTEIGYSAFASCSRLESVTLPKSLTDISYDAFNGCGSLSDIAVPSSVAYIGENAFLDTKWLEDRRADNPLVIVNGILIDGQTAAGKIEIPDGVKAITSSSFFCCSGISSVMIPESVRSVGGYAFFACGNLAEVTIRGDIEEIEDYTFDSCTNLTSVTLTGKITRIGDGAFQNCSNLGSITLPQSITEIRDLAFLGCEKLKDVYYGGSKEQWEWIQIRNANESLTNAVIHFGSAGGTSQGNETVGKPMAVTAENVRLSKSSVTYNGKAQTPSVIATDSQGNTIDSSGYTVSYKNNKNVGQAAVTVTFKGNYTGTVTKNFTILPQGTKIIKSTSKKKGFTVKWKKQAVQTSGYQIQYAANSKFKGAKLIGKIKPKTTSKTITKLKAKKKFYIRIRTYKTVKINGKSTKLYSGWSNTKSVVTKK